MDEKIRSHHTQNLFAVTKLVCSHDRNNDSVEHKLLLDFVEHKLWLDSVEHKLWL